mmetsp:Transcript_35516/g.57154  ORF Transcript_35516/g.57154 Transcript_35516/m.57154 type:complete len:236 (-) Transcript_35516:36-743(-)
MSVELSEMCKGVQPCVVEPCSYLVAFSGVLTLRFRGFPPQLVGLKERMQDYQGLAKEGPGSLWPKTTLGALVDGKRLDREALKVLQDLCAKGEERLKSMALQLPVDVLSLVFYENRALERRFQTTPLPLVPQGAGARDVSAPAEEQLKRSDDTQLETLEESYWEKASKDGNREPHYRSPHPGTTLVWDYGKLEIDAVQKLLKELQVFRQEVMKALPGYYVFFDEGCLHVTIRGMQ